MPTDNLNKIDSNTESVLPVAHKDVSDDSILIPKIDVSENSRPKRTSAKKILTWAFAFFGIFLIYNLVAAFLIYGSAKNLISSLDSLKKATEAKDLTILKREIGITRQSITVFDRNLRIVSWVRVVPYFGRYANDFVYGVRAARAGLEAAEIIAVTVEPYSDLLGLVSGPNAGSKTSEQTTQERIDFLVKTIPEILPKIDELSVKIGVVNSELAKIDPLRYPEKFKGQLLRSRIKSLQDITKEVSTLVGNGRPVLESAPYLLGMDSPRIYFILFQNDKELRPTGGFMTAYAIMKVDKAKFEPVSSNDIYNLDAVYKPSIQAPQPIVKYIKGPYIISQNLRLRDMNWSPDFGVSMETFTNSLQEVGVKEIDGIIAVDTQLLTNILSVTGPIGVPGFGNFSTEIDPECNCPQAVHELESFADVEGPIVWDPVSGKIVYKPKNADNRKSIIGPLMNSVMANALAQPKEKLPDLFQAGYKSLIEKHVLFYLHDLKVQTALSDFGLAGKIKDYEGDYLHINDANLGGRKSNLYATEDVDQNIEVARDGSVTKTITITHKNPEKHDGWLNSVLPTWVRVYVPKGSELITVEGLEAKEDPYEEFGKTVFSGFFQLRPEGVSKLTFKYKLPFKVSKEYKLLIQKQPGTDGFLYTIKLNKYQEEFLLKTDKEIKIGL